MGTFFNKEQKMIKREDVIIDPTDPRVEGLIGKPVMFGDIFSQLREELVIGELRLSPDKNDPYPFRQGLGSHYAMIAPIPEPEPEPEPIITPQGISLRDYFAGCALSAMAGMSEKGVSRFETLTNEKVAKEVYQVADAMLKARSC